MLRGKGKVHKKGRYGGVMIYISADVAKDSQFPFKPGDEVLVEIDVNARALVIKRAEKLGN